MKSRIEEALVDRGYTQVAKHEFRAPWSSSKIDHLVYLRWGKKYVDSLNVRVGIRHRESDKFAGEMLVLCGYPPEKSPLRDEKHFSQISFDLAHICSWDSILLVPVEIGAEATERKIISGLQDSIFPLFGLINDDVDLYNFLTNVKTNDFWPPIGAARAAEAIYLGKRLGYSQQEIFADIEFFRTSIASQAGPSMTVDNFLTLAWSKA